MKHNLSYLAALLFLAACTQEGTPVVQAQSITGQPPQEYFSEACKAERNLAGETAEKLALMQREDYELRFRAEQEAQVKGFAYDFHRFGDFLSVYLTRNGGKDRDKDLYSTTLNIGATKEIQLQRGTGVDDQYTLTYYFTQDIQDSVWPTVSVKCVSYSTSNTSFVYVDTELQKLQKYKVVVKPYFPSLPTREFTQAPKWCYSSSVGSSGSYGATVTNAVPCYYPSYITGSYGIEHITKNFPRAAEDDRIVFTGIDVTLFAPYGLGEGMRNRLLEEIAKVR